MKDYKIGLLIFLFLATVISLFPPFEFGNEKLKTLKEKKIENNIYSELPIKRFDFIFNNNKKYFAFDSCNFQEYFKNKASLEYCKKLWSDCKFRFYCSKDSFFTKKKFLFNMFSNERYSNGVRKTNDAHIPRGYIYEDEFRKKFNYALTGEIIGHHLEMGEVPNNEYYSSAEYSKDQDLEEDKYDAINYWEYKRNFDKSLKEYWELWNVYKFDRVKKCDLYWITQPIYYSLKRELLAGELVIEYILAFILSVAVQLIINWKRKPIR